MLVISSAMLALGTLSKGPSRCCLAARSPSLGSHSEHRVAKSANAARRGAPLFTRRSSLPWFILIEARNPGFLRFFFIHEHLQRYVFERAWMGSVAFHSDSSGRNVALDFFRAARIVRHARRPTSPALSESAFGDSAPPRHSSPSGSLCFRFLLDTPLQARQLHPSRDAAARDRRRIRSFALLDLGTRVARRLLAMSRSQISILGDSSSSSFEFVRPPINPPLPSMDS